MAVCAKACCRQRRLKLLLDGPQHQLAGAVTAAPLTCTTLPSPRPQYYDVTGQGTNDYPVTDLLQMMGRASRPLHDEQGM